MAGGGDGAERTEEATPRKREDARKQGNVFKSMEVIQAASLLTCAFLLPGLASELTMALMKTIKRQEVAIPTKLSAQSAIQYTAEVASPMLLAAAPLIFTLMVLGVASNLAQVGFLLSGQSLKPDFKKINPFEGFKRLFGKRAAFDGFKAIFKLFLFSTIVGMLVKDNWEKVLMLNAMPTVMAGKLIGEIAGTMMSQLATVWIALAALDFFFQRKQYENQLKMTKQELKQEMKDQESSPEIKMARHRRRRQLTKGSLAARLREAEVVVTNPTHFAVALKYDRSSMHAPMVVAKGQDYLALKIREVAGKEGIPLVENRPLARALYRECEVGDYVPRDLFNGVAEVLAYVYKTVQRVRRPAA